MSSSLWSSLDARMCGAVLLLCALLPLTAGALSERQREVLRQRIQPAGQVCLSTQPCAAAVQTAPVFSGPRTGEQVYQVGCTSCHTSGVADAPRIGAAADWVSRTAKGVETLYANALNGYGTMPARGVCLDCSDDEVRAAVDYMLEQEKS